ncbi:MAG: hypothetical protein WBG71_04475 [Leeuwenhoekiella sp.]
MPPNTGNTKIFHILENKLLKLSEIVKGDHTSTCDFQKNIEDLYSTFEALIYDLGIMLIHPTYIVFF